METNKLPEAVLFEANKIIEEGVLKTGLTKEQILLYLTGKVDRDLLLRTWCTQNTVDKTLL